jgi:hypothetical protein
MSLWGASLFKHYTLLFVSLFWGRISCNPGWLWTCYVTKNDRKLLLLLLLLLPCKCWDHKHAPPCLAYLVQGNGAHVLVPVRQALYQLGHIHRPQMPSFSWLCLPCWFVSLIALFILTTVGQLLPGNQPWLWRVHLFFSAPTEMQDEPLANLEEISFLSPILKLHLAKLESRYHPYRSSHQNEP